MSKKGFAAFLGIAAAVVLTFTQVPQLRNWLNSVTSSLWPSIEIFQRNPREWFSGLTRKLQPTIQQVQANWATYSAVATIGFAVGVPVFRWLYNKAKARNQEILQKKSQEAEMLRTANEGLTEKIQTTEAKVEEIKLQSTSELTTLQSKVTNVTGQYDELKRSVQRITDERDYLQGQLNKALTELEKYKPKPIA